MSVREVAVGAYREALPALAASVVGGLFAGAVLGGMRADLEAVTGLLVFMPAYIATRGNVYGSLGARLATGLHQGLLDPALDVDDDRLRAAVAAALANGVLVSAFAAAATWGILTALGSGPAGVWRLVATAAIAGVLSGIALTVVVVTVVFTGFRRGLDPDAFVGPLVTTTGDAFGLAFLLLAVRAVGALAGGW